MTPASPRTLSRTREILQDLEAVRENLLALSDDIWAGINRQDLVAFDEGVRFMRSFVEKNSAFDRVATDLSSLVQQFMSVRLEESEQTGSGDQEQNERIIAELNREEPHSIDEDFTFKRPFGFIFDGEAATGVTTWQRLYGCNGPAFSSGWRTLSFRLRGSKRSRLGHSQRHFGSRTPPPPGTDSDTADVRRWKSHYLLGL